jgi:ribose-phosphate pyrophosphokinase
MNWTGEIAIFSGNAHKGLADAVSDSLSVPIGDVDVFQFSNENIFVRYLENIRHRDVFLIQPHARPVNDSIMELLIMIDAAKRASAGRVTAVIPYYAYGRTDKKDQPRVPITARLLADLITTAGADRVLTMDLHAGQIQGFFNIPVDELTALPLLSNYLVSGESNNQDYVVVAPDEGTVKRARNLAYELDAPLAIIEKRRVGNDEKVEARNVIGEVTGKNAILIDDEIDTGGSMVAALEVLWAHGVTEISAMVTHPVLSGDALVRLAESGLKKLVVTDTLPIDKRETNGMELHTVSVASLLAEAISRIHSGESIGELFS